MTLAAEMYDAKQITSISDFRLHFTYNLRHNSQIQCRNDRTVFFGTACVSI